MSTNKTTRELFSNHFIRRFGNLLTSIIDHKNYGHDVVNLILKDYINFINHRVKHEGRKKAIEVLKGIHTIAVHTAMERPITPISFIKSDKKGIPRIIKPLVPLLKGSGNMKRVALSITKLYLAIYLKPSRDFSNITDPYTGT
jgi:hypothetical protein